jgi:hypothetical protein
MGKIKLFRNEDGVLVIEKCGIIEEHYLTEGSFLEDMEALSKDGYFEISNDVWELVSPIFRQ